MISYFELNTFLAEYTERNTDNQYKPVAVGRYGIRTRESIYSKELAKDYSKNKVIFQNTLTVGMGSVQIDIGILTENVKYSVSPAYHTYKITGINPDYLRYCLECRNKDMFERYVKRGSRQGKTIDLGRWLTYEIPVCETQEQKEIVSKLDFVDSLITARREQLAKLDELVKSRFIELFGSPIANEYGWPIATLGELCLKITDGEHQNPQFVDNGMPMVMANNVQDKGVVFDGCRYISTENYEKFSRKCCPEFGDVLLVSRGATIGRCCINSESIPFSLMGSVILIKNNKERISSAYLVNWLKNEEIKPMIYTTSSASAQQAIYMKDLVVRKVAVPPMELQEQYAAFVEQTDKSKLAIQASLDKLETLKKSLMQEYFG